MFLKTLSLTRIYTILTKQFTKFISNRALILSLADESCCILFQIYFKYVTTIAQEILHHLLYSIYNFIPLLLGVLVAEASHVMTCESYLQKRHQGLF